MDAKDIGTVQILPATDFKLKLSRSGSGIHYKINKTIAGKLIAKLKSQHDHALIDYELQTLAATTTGKPAPAAGWFKSLQWVDGKGLFALGVDWTTRGKQSILSGQYQHIIPALTRNALGEVTGISLMGLSKWPTIDGIAPLGEANAMQYHALSSTELEVCRLLGMDSKTFAYKQETVALSSTINSSGLSIEEQEVCRRLNLQPSEFLKAR